MFEVSLNVYRNQSPRQTYVVKHRTRFRPNVSKPVAIKFDFKIEVSRENDEIRNSKDLTTSDYMKYPEKYKLVHLGQFNY